MEKSIEAIALASGTVIQTTHLLEELEDLMEYL